MQAMEVVDHQTFLVRTLDGKPAFHLQVRAHQSGPHVFVEFWKKISSYDSSELLFATVHLVEGLTRIYEADVSLMEQRHGVVRGVADAKEQVKEAEKRLVELRAKCDRELKRLKSYETMTGLSEEETGPV